MTPKNRVHTARRIRKGAFLSGHCGGGPEKRAPANGWVLTFATNFMARDEKESEPDEVFVSDELLDRKARKR